MIENRLSPTVSPPSKLHARRVILFVSALLFLIAFVCFAGASWPIVVARWLSDGLILAVWIASSAGIGRTVWLVIAFESSRGVQWCASIALGLGAIGLITLFLGLAGLLTTFSCWAVVSIGLGLYAWQSLRHLKAIDRTACSIWLTSPSQQLWWIAAATPLVAITSVATLAPPGMLWGDEPNGYDVVEYHLQIPREWYEGHRIVPLDHNVFSYFPQNMEMHYLLAMNLRGGPWAGMYLAQMMHAAMISLAVLSIVSLAAERSKACGAVAGVAMLASPWLLLLAPVAYNEGAMLLYGSLAIGLVWRTIRETSTVREWILAGTFAGLACGAKLTAGPMVLAAVVFAALITWVVDRHHNSFRDVAIRLVAFVVAAIVLLSPWLIRDVVWTHNPVFPEMSGIFGNGNGRFTIDQIERWRIANHLPGVGVRSFAARCAETLNQILGDWRYGFALLPVAIISSVIAMRNRLRQQAAFAAAMLVLMLIFWFGFTHLQSRFFVLAIPVAALAIAWIESALWRRVVVPLLVVMLIVGICNFYARYAAPAKMLDAVTQNHVLGAEPLDELSGVDLRNVPAESTVSLVGDAKAFWYSRPMSTLRYRTVFDAGSLPQDWVSAWVDPDVAADATIVVSPNELSRLSRTYWKLPAPPADVGRHDGPYLMQR